MLCDKAAFPVLRHRMPSLKLLAFTNKNKEKGFRQQGGYETERKVKKKTQFPRSNGSEMLSDFMNRKRKTKKRNCSFLPERKKKKRERKKKKGRESSCWPSQASSQETKEENQKEKRKTHGIRMQCVSPPKTNFFGVQRMITIASPQKREETMKCTTRRVREKNEKEDGFSCRPIQFQLPPAKPIAARTSTRSHARKERQRERERENIIRRLC
jgi:predicted SPOUT superfamily RNA methylase MTH1